MFLYNNNNYVFISRNVFILVNQTSTTKLIIIVKAAFFQKASISCSKWNAKLYVTRWPSG